MQIKEARARLILDSRREQTIEISVNGCRASAPYGKSRGLHEKPAYRDSAAADAKFINRLKESSLPEIRRFEELRLIENLVKDRIGANTLFALESAILKALAKSQKKELWQLLNPNAGKTGKIPLLISNTICGGRHSRLKTKPDFQEFLVIGGKKSNSKAYAEAKKLLHATSKGDENAWQTSFENEQVLEIMKYASLRTGIDAAASEFYADGKYYYKNRADVLTRQQQMDYVIGLIKGYGLSYVEDPLNEEDFQGFAEILRATGGKCLIVGDDLTVTNHARLQKAIEKKAINAMIIKPNQNGSLLEVKEAISLCKKAGIRTIMSHRSGETMDDTIADLAVAWGCDYLKIPVAGRERLAKVERLIDIERRLK